MIVAGSGIYEMCACCNKIVKINKFLFGGLHFCSDDPADKPFQYNASREGNAHLILGSFDPYDQKYQNKQ